MGERRCLKSKRQQVRPLRSVKPKEYKRFLGFVITNSAAEAYFAPKTQKLRFSTKSELFIYTDSLILGMKPLKYSAFDLKEKGES